MPPQVHFDPFSTEGIKEIPSLLSTLDAIWEGFHFSSSLESRLLRLDEYEIKPLPNLDPDLFHLDLKEESLPDLSIPPSISDSESSNDEFVSLDGESIAGDVADIWILSEITKRRPKGELLSWDLFLDKEHDEPGSGYLSEANPPAFNAILMQESIRYVKTDILLHSLFELCMGRGSALFEREEESESFVPRWQNVAAVGYSSILLQNCFESFSKIGAQTRTLMTTFQPLDRKPQHLSPSQIALLSASRSVLFAAHKFLEISRPKIMSFLQLKGIMRKVSALISTLQQCTNAIRRGQTDHLIVSDLVKQLTKASLRHPGTDSVLQQIFSRTCRPILAQLSEEVGLSPAQNTPNDNSSWEVDSGIKKFWDSFCQSDFSQTILESRQSLNLLKLYALECPVLSNTRFGSSFLMALEPGFTMETVCECQSRSVAYEEAMRSLIVSAESSASTSSLSTPISESSGAEVAVIPRHESMSPFRLELGIFDLPPDLTENGEHDELQDQVMLYLEGQHSEALPLQLDMEESLGLCITPLVSAQHRLLSYSVLQLLFQEHHLIAHVNLQRELHLFGDAFFASRLSVALFDPEQNSGEGQRRTGSSTGLRLQGRDTWPPASSELRLVLMGILSDSLAGRKDRVFEDSVSFAIRDLPLDELERCRDVDSIHALDFLRLQYKPPNEVLETVLTQDILDKYDRIFQHLLRTLRLRSVTQQLVREQAGIRSESVTTSSVRKVVLEMHHFVTTVADFNHNAAVEVSWRKLEGVLRLVQTHIDNKDYEQTLRTVKSQDHLRALHERTLDRILHSLLLKSKQSRTRQILEDIYQLILEFTAERKKKSLPSDDRVDEQGSHDVTHETRMQRLSAEFRSKVVQFIDALRAQDRSPNHVQDSLEEEENADGDINLFEYLVLRLDMFGYWTQ